MKTIFAIAALAVGLSGCAALQAEPPSGDEVTYNTTRKIEITGLSVMDPATMRPIFFLGQMGYDEGSAPAVHTEQTAPLQAHYRAYDPESGVLIVDATDGTTSCTGFTLATSAEGVPVNAGIDKDFCMGVGAQDLAIGLTGSAPPTE